MTMSGWLGGLLAVLSIPVVFLIGASQSIGSSLAFGSAQAAAPFALPSLAAVAGFAVLAAWLVRLRRLRWSRVAVDFVEPIVALTRSGPESDPESAFLALPEIAAPPPAAPPPGADLAARARFVAMTFAFPEAGLTRPGSSDWPLHISCQPTRFTLTLRHAALGYRLELCNRGAETLGPLIIRADLIAGGSRIAQHSPPRFEADPLPLCHYLDNLPAGETFELTGELRLPLAGIAAMRLGTAELLVPLMRLCAESAGESWPALSVSASFAIGIPPLTAGGGIQPFRLDSGPGIWRKLTARRAIDAELS